MIQRPNRLLCFVFLFLPAILLSASVSFLLYQDETKHQEALHRREEAHVVAQQQRGIRKLFVSIASDLQMLADFCERHSNWDESEADLAELTAIMQTFSQRRQVYDQIRLLDQAGMERIRINLVQGRAVVVPKAALQPKGNRYYFLDAFKLELGQIFISPFDLNVEHDQIEIPIKPMLRFGTPVADRKKKKQGTVILNYLGQEILDQLAEQESSLSGKLMLLNQEGYWLHGERPGDAWAFMWPERSGRTFAARWPQAWKRMLQADSGQFSLDGSLYSFSALHPLSKGMRSSTGTASNFFAKSHGPVEWKQYRWMLLSRLPFEQIREDLLPFKHGLILFNLLLVLLLGPAAWLLISFYASREASRRELDHFKAVLDQTHDSVFMFDPETLLFTYVNQGAQRQVGYSREELLSMTPLAIKSEFDEASFRAMLAPMIEETAKNIVFQTWHRRKDGTSLPAEVRLQHVLAPGGGCFVAIVRDISERKKAEEALRDAHQRLLTVLDSLDAMVYVIDLESYELLFLNQYAVDIFGDARGSVCWQSLQKGQEGPCKFCPNDLLRKGGEYFGRSYVWEQRNSFNGRCYELRDRVIQWLNGREVKIQIATDITVRLERELANKKLATAIEHVPVSVLITDPEGIIEYVNPHLLRISRYSREDVLGKTPNLFSSGKTPLETYQSLWSSIANGKEWHGALVNHKKDGEEHVEEIWIAPVADETSKILNYVGVKQDITERMRLEQQLRRNAYHDSLTGLPNRLFFYERIDQEVFEADRCGSKLALVFLDLKGFKPINDQHGHDVGDQLLKKVADRLLAAVRRNDLVARMGGDEFVLLLPDLQSRAEALRIVAQVDEVISRPCRLAANLEVTITADAGTAVYPDDGLSADELLIVADRLMYDSKRARRC